MCGKMFRFPDICLICLENTNNLIHINTQDTNGISIENKLKYCLPETDLNSNIPKYICVDCAKSLNNFHKFKQKCLQNIAAYIKYAQQITANSQIKIEVFNDENCNTNLEKNDIEEIIIKQELESNHIEEESCGKNENISEDENHLKIKPYTCEICKKLFRRLQYLKDHQLIHTGEKPFTCEVCNKSFRQSAHLRQHQLIHTGEKPHKCKLCIASFNMKHNLLRHMKNHPDCKYKCEDCDEKFVQKSKFKRHRFDLHMKRASVSQN